MRTVLRPWMAMLMALSGLLLVTAGQAQELLRVSGTGSGTGAMQLLARAFMEANPGVRVEVLPATGSGGGIAAVLDGKLDLALSNRPPNDKELARAALKSAQYATTPFLLAVGPTVKTRNLTSAQLAALYAEGAASYPDGQRARPVMRLSDATDTALVKGIAPEVSVAVEAANLRRGMIDAGTDSEAADLIERTPGAFGGSTLALILSEKRALAPLALNGVEPTVQNLEAGRYAFSKKLFYVVLAQAGPNTQKLAGFLKGPQAQRILQETGHSVR
jgi:phosphate transport system substrate-binding protein